MTRLEWLTIGDGLLGDAFLLPRFIVRGRRGAPRVVLVSGFRSDDVLGPEVLRALYKEAGQWELGCELVGWPLLPSSYLGGEGRGRADGLRERIDEVVGESHAGADAVIHLTSPEETEASPYAIVPSRKAFPVAGTFERSAALAATSGAVYTIEEQPLSRLGLAAARAGVPFVQVVAGARVATTRALRSDLRRRLGWMLDAVGSGSGGPGGVPGRIDTVRAREAGFLHLRASLGEEISPDEAIAATWAFEPDSVEEFFLRSGRVLELSRKGRVEVGDVVARSITPLD